jgi:hypothetical protein
METCAMIWSEFNENKIFKNRANLSLGGTARNVTPQKNLIHSILEQRRTQLKKTFISNFISKYYPKYFVEFEISIIYKNLNLHISNK